MKLGAATKLDKKTKQHQKNLGMTSCQQIRTLLSFFRFMANLKQPGSQIPDA